MTTQGTEARRGETVGLDAKRDGLFGAADAPQPTDNAETIMTDVQQAVPVAQIDREAAADLFCIVFPTDKSIGNALRRPNGDGPWTQAFARHRLAALPDATQTREAELLEQIAALEKRGAEAVIAYHVAICSPKGVVPDDTLYDAKMVADIQAALDAGIPIRAALNGRDAA